MSEHEAVAMIFFVAITGLVAVILIVTRYFRRRLESQEAIKALESGQPLPSRKPKRGSFGSDLRSGVLTINFAIGLGLFIWLVDGGREGIAIAFIPLFIGIGFITSAYLGRRLGEGGDDRPTPASPSDPRGHWVAEDDNDVPVADPVSDATRD